MFVENCICCRYMSISFWGFLDEEEISMRDDTLVLRLRRLVEAAHAVDGGNTN
jgi:hypothetical protein